MTVPSRTRDLHTKAEGLKDSVKKAVNDVVIVMLYAGHISQSP